MPAPMITNEEKARVWETYQARRPIRVPVRYGVNPRLILLNPALNPQGYTFQDYFHNADVLIDVQLAFMEHQTQVLNRYCDNPLGRPKTLTFYVDTQNMYDSAYFGAPVSFRDGQVPDVEGHLRGRDKLRIFEVDIDHPMDNPFVRQCLKRHEDLVKAAGKVSCHGMTFNVAPPLLGFDGPLTIATNLRGTELFVDLYEDPAYVRRLLEFIQRGVILRQQALYRHFGRKWADGPGGSLADDSVQLISTDMYRDFVLPLHRAWYAQWSIEGPHMIHLCGNATRHFPTIHEELHVESFDTGFPVNFGWLREALGDDVEISGGVEVALLLGGTPPQVYDRAREILASGIMRGGRFILQEANNLPPRCPETNLEAMYRACLDHGRYPTAQPAAQKT